MHCNLKATRRRASRFGLILSNLYYCRRTYVWRARMRPWLLIFAGYRAWRSQSGPRDWSDESSWGTSYRALTGVCDGPWNVTIVNLDVQYATLNLITWPDRSVWVWPYVGRIFVLSADFRRNITFRVSRLANVNVYQLMCHVMQLVPQPHNGTWSSVCDALTDGDACVKGPYNGGVSLQRQNVADFSLMMTLTSLIICPSLSTAKWNTGFLDISYLTSISPDSSLCALHKTGRFLPRCM